MCDTKGSISSDPITFVSCFSCLLSFFHLSRPTFHLWRQESCHMRSYIRMMGCVFRSVRKEGQPTDRPRCRWCSRSRLRLTRSGTAHFSPRQAWVPVGSWSPGSTATLSPADATFPPQTTSLVHFAQRRRYSSTRHLLIPLQGSFTSPLPKYPLTLSLSRTCMVNTPTLILYSPSAKSSNYTRSTTLFLSTQSRLDSGTERRCIEWRGEVKTSYNFRE